MSIFGSKLNEGRSLKYALVNNERKEASQGLKGLCPCCGNEMIAKCGEIKIPHWAHKGKRVCDHWWENESEWHRYWKNNFPVSWQEVIHFSNEGEKHIADVKTSNGWIIEFQHSFLKPDERNSRDRFYGKIIWVVDGTRRKTDIKQFHSVWMDGVRVNRSDSIKRVYIDEARILKEWASSDSPIFFDFGIQDIIWWLAPRTHKGHRNYLMAFSRNEFIKMHLKGTTIDFERFLDDFRGLVLKLE